MAAPANVLAGIMQRDLQRGEACPETGDDDSGAITLASQTGIFLVVLASVAVALLLALWEARQAERLASATKAEDATDHDQHAAHRSALTDAEIMRETAAQVQTLLGEMASLRAQVAASAPATQEVPATSTPTQAPEVELQVMKDYRV